MPNHRDNPIPAVLYKVFVYGFGSLCVIYLVAPIVIALMMSFTSGQTLKYPPQGFSCAGMKRYWIPSGPLPNISRRGIH